MMIYTVTVTDWTQRRGYKNSGRGWRVRCFGMPDDDWNSLGRTVSETYHRTEAAARACAEDLAKLYNCEVPKRDAR
jgi:hypothetical protein